MNENPFNFPNPNESVPGVLNKQELPPVEKENPLNINPDPEILKVEYAGKIEETLSDIERIRESLGLPPDESKDPPPSVAQYIKKIEFISLKEDKEAYDSQLQVHLEEFSGYVDKFTKIFKNRVEDGNTEIFDEDFFFATSQSLAGLEELSQRGLNIAENEEKQKELFEKIDSLTKLCEQETYRTRYNEDEESLGSLEKAKMLMNNAIGEFFHFAQKTIAHDPENDFKIELYHKTGKLLDTWEDSEILRKIHKIVNDDF